MEMLGTERGALRHYSTHKTNQATTFGHPSADEDKSLSCSL